MRDLFHILSVHAAGSWRRRADHVVIWADRRDTGRIDEQDPYDLS
jgi:hypothetical protein